MGTRVKWFHFALISVINGAVAGDKLLMKSLPSTDQTNTLAVTEGTDVSLTCYSRDGRDLPPVRWSKGGNIGTTSFNDTTKNCTVLQGQFDNNGGKIYFHCNRTSSTIMIQGVLKTDSKEWTCSPKDFGHRSITLEVQSVSSSMSTSTTTTTTTTTTEPPSTPEPTTEPPATTSTSVTNGHPTAPPSHSSSSSREQTDTSVEDHTETTGEETYGGGTRLYIILPSTLGGAVTLALCVFLAWRTRTSRKRNLSNGSLRKKGTDSQEDILEMEENPAYWTSMEAAESSSSKSEDTVPFVKAEMQDNPVYWTSNNATGDSTPQLKDKDEQANPVYWTIEPSSTNHPTQVKAEDEQANAVYWTIEPDSQEPSHPGTG
ncbi:salivary glue protein Sgs-3-like [Haliotis rubra]|uniref:salivary glue protein Sgs-3-like n=1 Tax=Haliotis rubra TaxID=36100 RepID=UPI001EE5AEE0|nr:salivary glue protein Sgs-3-like [Haliotis rubra]